MKRGGRTMRETIFIAPNMWRLRFSHFQPLRKPFWRISNSSLDLQETLPPHALREDVHPPAAEGRCTCSLKGGCTSSLQIFQGRMYILPRCGRMYISPRRGNVHLPFAGGCTSSLSQGRMHILPQPREDVHPPVKGRCTSSPDIIQVKLYILYGGKMYILPSQRVLRVGFKGPSNNFVVKCLPLFWLRPSPIIISQGRMYILPRGEDVHLPFAGGCTSSLSEGRMYILPSLREDVHVSAKGGCT